MKILYFDCFSGISGDMILGALLDLGIKKKDFISELNKLKLLGYEINAEKVVKYGISGTNVDVIINDEYNNMVSKLGMHTHIHDKNCKHHHKHENNEERNLDNIESLIDCSDLNDSVKNLSKDIFREIAKAEAKVHSKNIDEVHFHEVGAVDSIVDIVGAAICIDMLGVNKIYSSPIHDGNGFIECQHGRLPVPVPAVVEMLTGSNIPYICDDVNTELVTPTGLAILKTICSYYGNMPEILIDNVGYGMGKRDIGKFNALRVIKGDLLDSLTVSSEDVTLLETSIDDMNPEMLGFTMEKLLEYGALDAYYTPIYMKKNRLGIKLTVLVRLEDEDKILKIILSETSTIGVRIFKTKRYVMDREIKIINTKYGDIKVKIAKSGDITKYSPEYEDCKTAAIQFNEPLWKVYNEVNQSMGN